MCFHNSMSAKARQLAERYGRKSDILEIAQEIIEEKRRNGELEDLALEEYRASAYPVKINNEDGQTYSYKKYPIITAEEQIQVFEWGLIPFWTKNAQDADEVRRMTVNARAETIFKKNSYRGPIKYRRCIVPSTGYFEYHYSNPKAKGDPYFIFLKNQPIFSMAGIYDTWMNQVTGQEIMTFSIVTTPGNALTNKIHNGNKNPFRMPLILTPEQENLWLDNSLKIEKEIKEFLVTFPEDDMDAYPVIKEHFLHSDIHSQDIIEPDKTISNVNYTASLF